MKDKFEIFFSKIILILKKPEMGVLPGHLAFFFVLSIVPLITLLVFFGSFLNIPSNQLLSFFNKSLPSNVSSFLVPAFTENTINFGTILLLLVTLFIASNGFHSIIVTSNTLYNIKNANPIKSRIKAFIVTMIFLGLILFMFIIPIFGNQIINIISNLFHNKNAYNIMITIYNVLQIPLSLIFVYLSIKLIYTISPDEEIKSSEVTSGAIFTTVTWVFATQIYSFYISNFSNYSRVYGNLSNIIMLMLFIYLLSYIFVVGMALNASKAELEEQIEKTGKIKILKRIHNNKEYTK